MLIIASRVVQVICFKKVKCKYDIVNRFITPTESKCMTFLADSILYDVCGHNKLFVFLSSSLSVEPNSLSLPGNLHLTLKRELTTQ